jgi:hypothetical protein
LRWPVVSDIGSLQSMCSPNMCLGMCPSTCSSMAVVNIQHMISHRSQLASNTWETSTYSRKQLHIAWCGCEVLLQNTELHMTIASGVGRCLGPHFGCATFETVNHCTAPAIGSTQLVAMLSRLKCQTCLFSWLLCSACSGCLLTVETVSRVLLKHQLSLQWCQQQGVVG